MAISTFSKTCRELNSQLSYTSRKQDLNKMTTHTSKHDALVVKSMSSPNSKEQSHKNASNLPKITTQDSSTSVYLKSPHLSTK